MLRPLPSLALSEHKSTEYISQALRNHEEQLCFTYQGSSNPHYPIINLRVIDFLNRKTIKKTHFVSLNLNKCQLNDEALTLLTRGNWRALQNLSLFSNRLTSRSFRPLSRASWKRIEKIDLGSNCFSSDNGEQLADCNWGKLAHLDLSGNSTKLVFITKLTGNCWRGLRSVNLSNNLLSNSSLARLVAFEWAELESLDLQRNLLTDDGLRVLSRGQWEHLQNLYISYNPIGVGGLLYLSRNGWGKQMKIEMVCNQDMHNNLLPFSVMILQNLVKCIRSLNYPQSKMAIVLSKNPTSVIVPEPLASALCFRNIVLTI